MEFITNMLIVLIAFLAMEGVAWSTHKFVMHGLLWRWHRDHHKKETYGFFEKNDYFFLVFAIPGMLGLWYGMRHDYNYFFWIGLGITLYGFTYFLVHDVFIHQRIKWFRTTEWRYFKAIRRAHKIHHKHLGKEQGECFGMLWVPLKYYRKASG
jgi:beta-carotene 3-hydroxylase